MNSKDYWREREAKWQKQQIKDDEDRKAEISKRLQYARDQIQKEIDAQWHNFSNGEKITIAEARKRASKMDVEAFSRKAQKYVEDKDFSAEANEQLKLYNLTMRINRLELLKSNIGLELVSSFDDIDKYMASELDQASRAEIERQAGILGMTISDAKASEMVLQAVNGSYQVTDYPTFSESLWQYQSELKSDLDKIIVRSITQGKNPRDFMSEIGKHMTDEGRLNATFNAQRLLISEVTRVQTDIQKMSYDQAKVDEYEYIAEPGACDECAPLDGKIFKVKDMQPGLNAPGMHPFCRCSTAGYVNREAFEADLEARGALA